MKRDLKDFRKSHQIKFSEETMSSCKGNIIKKILLITEQPEINPGTQGNPYLPNILQCLPNNSCWGNVVHNPVALSCNTHPFGNSSLTLIRLNEIFTLLRNRGYTFYWTHWIKCPRQGNNKNQNKQYFNDECAQKWINQEISSFRPDVIFSFGEHATMFILQKSACLRTHNHEFMDILWEFLRTCFRGRNKRRITLRGINPPVHIYLIPLPHPSGRHNLSRLFFDKNNQIRAEIISYLKTKQIL